MTTEPEQIRLSPLIAASYSKSEIYLSSFKPDAASIHPANSGKVTDAAGYFFILRSVFILIECLNIMQIKNPQIQSLRLTSPIILAPMAGITNLPYRRIMKESGAGLVFTEMISANGMIRDGRKTRQLLDSHPEEEPLGVQLFGEDPEVLAKAAEMVSGAGALIDINMGCPVKKVIRNGAGSALLQQPQRIRAICRAVRRACSGPLTIKIRSGWDEASINYREIGAIAEDEGIDAITLHPRTRSQGFGGHSDWSHLAQLKSALQIPVFGSGDIFKAEDALRMLEQTGCDGVMIGRGGYGNPWLIGQILQLLSGAQLDVPESSEICRVALRHLELHRLQFGDHKAVLEMRKHLCWYARGHNGASQFRAIVQKTGDIEDLKQLTRSFFEENQAA